MSVLSVTQMWSRSGGSASTTNGLDTNTSFTEGYQVVHTYDTTILEVLNATGIPTKGSFYPGTFATCRDVDATKVGPLMHIVVAQWEGEAGQFGVADSPVNQLPEIEWGDTVSNEPIDVDWDGNPIVTANGEPIKGATMEIADQTLSVSRNYAAFSPWLTHQYRHSVNSDTFAGYPPGTARLVGFSATFQQSSTSFIYWKVNARIQFRFPYNTTPDKAWYYRTRHEGFRVKIGSDIVRAVDKFQVPVTTPVLLKSDGTLETNPANAHFLEFKRYQSLPYSALGLL
ncbi:hypothetical protein VN12_02285 [Pirellula sp. SH-Sr6A]|uniref:hypothetical protein n=1 Tax=Pirellula sp. SH-Sr6A TaxID=1632865 RepID=UPI00078D3316|nr:hypothetical protein [Pirellula sp. SH-Sr6A]AMV30915.1 hypothetical protein VN12_02285 [Pirellula sp. SH-Sr6A]